MTQKDNIAEEQTQDSPQEYLFFFYKLAIDLSVVTFQKHLLLSSWFSVMYFYREYVTEGL